MIFPCLCLLYRHCLTLLDYKQSATLFEGNDRKLKMENNPFHTRSLHDGAVLHPYLASDLLPGSSKFFGFRPDHPGRSGTLLFASLSDSARENQKTCEGLFRHSEASWVIHRFSFCRHRRREMGFENDLIRFSLPVYMLLWFPVAASLLLPLWPCWLYTFPGNLIGTFSVCPSMIVLKDLSHTG